jgi:hypothetical protein
LYYIAGRTPGTGGTWFLLTNHKNFGSLGFASRRCTLESLSYGDLINLLAPSAPPTIEIIQVTSAQRISRWFTIGIIKRKYAIECISKRKNP